MLSGAEALGEPTNGAALSSLFFTTGDLDLLGSRTGDLDFEGDFEREWDAALLLLL